MAGRKTDKDQSTTPVQTADEQQGSDSPPLAEALVLPFSDYENRRLIDEMNIIETPFALLAQKTSLTRLDLTRDGHRYIESIGSTPLPTALAEPVILGLLWMHHERDSLQNRVIQFKLRELVTQYVYPERFKSTRPNGRTISAVRDQLHRVAATRIYSDRWYDRRLNRYTKVDAAIIDYIQVIQDGGRNTPEIIEVAWGQKFYESVRAQYTKQLDPQIFLRIDKPIDRRLYRWLDRQLAQKLSQHFKSIQNFARSKLGMSGAVLDKGGRTASSYVASRLGESIERLSGIGFPTQLEIDTSTDDYSLTFSRIAGKGPNKITERDAVGDLLRFFGREIHGSNNDRRRRFDSADRAVAQAWLEAHGRDASEWMIQNAAQIHYSRTGEAPLALRALKIYEDAASGAWKRHCMKLEGQQELPLTAPTVPLWDSYLEYIFSQQQEPDADAALLEQFERELSSEPSWRLMGTSTRQKMLESRLTQEKIVRYNMLDRKTYDNMAMQSEASLVDEVRRRHGLDLDTLKISSDE